MTAPLIIESSPNIDLLHTLAIEVDDGGQIWLIDRCDDCVQRETVTIYFPADKAELIAAAIMRAAKEAGR